MANDDLVSVFEAMNMAEAQMIADALKAAGISSLVEQTASPLDGLTSIGEGTEVRVKAEDEDRAIQLIEDYLAEMDMNDEGIDEEGLGDEPDEDA